MTQPNRAARRQAPKKTTPADQPSPIRETSQAKRISALETKVENLQQLISKLFAQLAGPQIQQQLESQIMGALESGQPLNIGQQVPTPLRPQQQPPQRFN